MIAGFAIVAIGMVLGMVMVRVWDEASRAVAGAAAGGRALPDERLGCDASGAHPAAERRCRTPAGTPVITTEIRVLQPNYTWRPATRSAASRGARHSVDALASINNLENRNSLSVGQKLIIP